MGSAERNWGDVKYLKSEKRSHLSSEAVEKQATIFGASCMSYADIERKKTQASVTDHYKFWDEEDFDQQFDMLSDFSGLQSNTRVLKCYMESWENEHIRKKNDVSKAKLIHKYGGLEFDDVDNGEHLRICDKEMRFRRRRKKLDDDDDAGGWTALTYSSAVGEKPSPWPIFDGCPLHDCIATYYCKHPELNIKILLKKDQVEGIEYLMSLPKKKDENSEGSYSTDSDSASEQASKFAGGKVSAASKTRVGKSDESDTGPCGGCGKPVGPVHKCDRCFMNMHPFCGRTIGEEGYGSCVRCPKCE